MGSTGVGGGTWRARREGDGRSLILQSSAASSRSSTPAIPVTADDTRFRFHHPVTVRFRDIDIGGHAHHADALIYFEEARWAYWMEVVGQGLGGQAVEERLRIG